MSCKAIRNAMQTLLSENLNYGQEKKLLLLRSCQKTIIRRIEIFAPSINNLAMFTMRHLPL